MKIYIIAALFLELHKIILKSDIALFKIDHL